MKAIRSLKELYNKKDKDNIISELEYNIQDSAEVQRSLSEPLFSKYEYENPFNERNKALILAKQLEVEFNKELAKVKKGDLTWSKELEALLNEYSQNKFNQTSFDPGNFLLPYDVLDVNIWIRSDGIMATAMNDMLWTRFREYTVGDIVCMFLDCYCYLKNYNNKNGSINTKYQFEQYKQSQGRFLKPVYFICTQANSGESPFNKNWCYIPCLLTDNVADPVSMIPYAAVNIEKLITINDNTDTYTGFNTRWFTNSKYWKNINEIFAVGGHKHRSLTETIMDGTYSHGAYIGIPHNASLLYGHSMYTTRPFYVWACCNIVSANGFRAGEYEYKTTCYDITTVYTESQYRGNFDNFEQLYKGQEGYL